MSLIYKSESGKLEKYGYQIPGPFGINYVTKIWSSEVEDKDFSYMLKWVDDNLTWENNNEGKWKTYNCFTLDHPSIVLLKKNIHKEYLEFMKELGEEPDEVYINGWFNIFNIGQGQACHYHNFDNNSYLTGVVCLTDVNTTTDLLAPSTPEITPNYKKPLYDIIKTKNFLGSLVFFPQWTYHMVEQLNCDTKRVTIGFDIFTEDGFNLVDENHMYKRAVKLSL
jgi:hypothetical protein